MQWWIFRLPSVLWRVRAETAEEAAEILRWCGLIAIQAADMTPEDEEE